MRVFQPSLAAEEIAKVAMMIDLVGNTVSIPPSALAGLTGSTPVGFELSGSVAALGGSSFDRVSALVQLSGTGQLLSAVSNFREQLNTLQSASSDSLPAITAQAQGLVEAFNGLQDRIGSLPGGFGSISGVLNPDQLDLSLEQLATAAVTAGSSSLAGLAAIGIELQSTISPETGETALTLRIDQDILNAAIVANPSGTQAQLAEATAAFLAPLAELEADVASTAVAQSSLLLLGNATAIPTLDLENPAGPGATPVGRLSLAGSTAALNVPLPDNPDLALPARLQALLSGTPELVGANTVAAATAPAVDADRAAADASLLRQGVVDNPIARAINTNRFDPAYAALIAASHLSDFVWPTPAERRGLAEADTPAEVSAVAMARAIGDYNEAARSWQSSGR